MPKVFFKRIGVGAVTGMNGEFRITGLCDGPDTLTVSHIGCDTQDYGVVIEENTHFDIQLPHSQSHMDTVHIHDKHPDPKPTQSESSLSGKDLDKAAGKSLGEALKDLSGVNALQTGPSIFKPMIHGMHSNRIVIMNNGVRQESQQWGSEHAPEIDPFTATKLTVVKGANGVRYGPRCDRGRDLGGAGRAARLGRRHWQLQPRGHEQWLAGRDCGHCRGAFQAPHAIGLALAGHLQARRQRAHARLRARQHGLEGNQLFGGAWLDPRAPWHRGLLQPLQQRHRDFCRLTHRQSHRLADGDCERHALGTRRFHLCHQPALSAHQP